MPRRSCLSVPLLVATLSLTSHGFAADSRTGFLKLIDRPPVPLAPEREAPLEKNGLVHAAFSFAVDARIAVAVPCIGVQSFRWARENNAWQSRIGTVQAGFDAAARDAGIAKPGAEEKFVLRIQPNTGHKVLPESMTAAREWFVRWLKP